MVLRVIGGLVVGGFATYGMVKFAEATGIFGGSDFARGKVGHEPLEPVGLDASDPEAVHQGASFTAPLM